MELQFKIEQALLALDNERGHVDRYRRANDGWYGGSDGFRHPEDSAAALVRALAHEGLVIRAADPG